MKKTRMTKDERKSVIVAGVVTLAVVGVVMASIAYAKRGRPLFASDPPPKTARP